MGNSIKFKWGKLCRLPINFYQTYNSHSINVQAFYHPLPLHYLGHCLHILILLLLLLHSCFNYLSPALASRYEMYAFPNVFPVLPFPILYFLPKGPYSLPWHQLPWLCNCCFKLCLQMWSLFNSLLTLYDASIPVCLKINSPYLPENYPNAHIIDINYIYLNMHLLSKHYI